MSAFYPFRWGGSPKADIVCFFYRFSYMMASLIRFCKPYILLKERKKSLNPWRGLNPQSCIHIWGSCFSVAKEIFLLCLWHGMVPNLLFVLPSCLPHPPLIHHQWPLASAAFFATTDILHINLFKQANNCRSWANLTLIWAFWKKCFATNRFAEKIQFVVSSAGCRSATGNFFRWS